MAPASRPAGCARLRSKSRAANLGREGLRAGGCQLHHERRHARACAAVLQVRLEHRHVDRVARAEGHQHRLRSNKGGSGLNLYAH